MPDADRLHLLLAIWEGRILGHDWLDGIKPESRTARVAVRAQARREAIRECADELRAALDDSPSAETCAWTPDTSYDGVWESECGVLYQFMADGPLENGFAFCHNCGRPLVVRLDDSPSP